MSGKKEIHHRIIYSIVQLMELLWYLLSQAVNGRLHNVFVLISLLFLANHSCRSSPTQRSSNQSEIHCAQCPGSTIPTHRSMPIQLLTLHFLVSIINVSLFNHNPSHWQHALEDKVTVGVRGELPTRELL